MESQIVVRGVAEARAMPDAPPTMTAPLPSISMWFVPSRILWPGDGTEEAVRPSKRGRFPRQAFA